MDTFGSLLRQVAVSHGQKTAIVVKNSQISYEELDRATEEIAASLLERCQPGDRIAVRWPNSIETVKLIFACGKAGLICVPINVQLCKPEIGHTLRNSGAVLCFTHPEYVAFTGEAGSDCETLREVISSLPPVDKLRKTALPPVQANQAAMILYTSGTTAQFKGVTHSHQSLIEGARMFQHSIVSDLEVTLVMTQLAFISSFVTGLISTIAAGGTMILSPRYEPATVLDLIESFHCRYTFGLPAMAQSLVEEQQRKPRRVSSLRTFVASGDSVPLSTQNNFRDLFGIPIQEAYGMAEIGPALLNPAASIQAGSLGTPLEGVSAKIIDASGNTVKENNVGELTIRSPATFLKYWANPEATAQVFKNGYVHTGDLAWRDSQGYL